MVDLTQLFATKDILLDQIRSFFEQLPSMIELRDLEAQVDMAFWAKAMFWTTLVGLLISAGALYALYVSLKQTRRAISDTREIGEHQTQAYVYASAVTFDSGRFAVVCRNGGQTPATHFAVNGRSKVVKRGLVKENIIFADNDFLIFSALGPQDELSVALVESDTRVEHFLKGLTSPDEVVLVCGQIVYCTTFNHDHLTQFAFYISPASFKKPQRPPGALKTFSRIKAGEMSPLKDQLHRSK